MKKLFGFFKKKEEEEYKDQIDDNNIESAMSTKDKDSNSNSDQT
mgnify:CR=1 FL=1